MSWVGGCLTGGCGLVGAFGCSCLAGGWGLVGVWVGIGGFGADLVVSLLLEFWVGLV